MAMEDFLMKKPEFARLVFILHQSKKKVLWMLVGRKLGRFQQIMS